MQPSQLHLKSLGVAVVSVLPVTSVASMSCFFILLNGIVFGAGPESSVFKKIAEERNHDDWR